MVIAFVYFECKQNSSGKSNQSSRQYPVERLIPNYIPCLGQRGQNPYPVGSGTSPYRPYKGVPGGTFLRLHVYERGRVSPVEVMERAAKYVISVCKRAQKSYFQFEK